MSTTAHIGSSGFIPFAPPARAPVATPEAAKPFPHAGKRANPAPAPTADNGKKPRNPLLSGGNLLAAQESKNPPGLSEEEQKDVARLKKRDTEVRAHEQAHATAGGQYAGAAQLQYETGPDGGQYAVSGHVSIDVSPVAGDPKATIQKMQVVKRAANAPADPSAQDHSVAAKAEQEARTAREELNRQRTEESANGNAIGTNDDSAAGPQDGDPGGNGGGRRPPALDIFA